MFANQVSFLGLCRDFELSFARLSAQIFAVDFLMTYPH